MAVCDALYGNNATVISATASEEMQDEDFSTAVALENDCCEVDISNELPVTCDTINVSMIISKG